MNIETANKLVKLRKQNNLSQEELANRLGISRQAVSKWERAEAAPDTDNLIKLARLYKISLDDLLLSDKELIAEIDQEIEESIFTKNYEDNNESSNTDHRIINLTKTSRAVVPLVCTIGFFILGFTTKLWHIAWLFFLGVPLINSIILAFATKKVRYFNYSVFVTILFFLLGFIYDIWGYAWILFLTIPIFHTIFGKTKKIIITKN